MLDHKYLTDYPLLEIDFRIAGIHGYDDGFFEGVDEAKIRTQLLNEFGIEVGPGLGPLKGKIWRVGLMGYNATDTNVEHFLEALGKCLV